MLRLSNRPKHYLIRNNDVLLSFVADNALRTSVSAMYYDVGGIFFGRRSLSVVAARVRKREWVRDPGRALNSRLFRWMSIEWVEER